MNSDKVRENFIRLIKLSKFPRKINISTQFLMIALAATLILAESGCKSQKKLKEKQAAEQAEKDRLAKEKAEAEERERKQREQANAGNKKSETTEEKIENYFEAIANSGSVNSANSSISEILTLFSSPDAPVLIIIGEEDGTKDYDRPTTIRNYLNYLKDQKKNPDAIANIVYDDAGKVKELELKKK